jgi:hypothetical protein
LPDDFEIRSPVDQLGHGLSHAVVIFYQEEATSPRHDGPA